MSSKLYYYLFKILKYNNYSNDTFYYSYNNSSSILAVVKDITEFKSVILYSL